MPRPRHADPPVEWRINIPESLAAQVNLKLWDPDRHAIRYGARSRLITHLLEIWLEHERQTQ